MPELPEVETVRRGLAPAMEGARIVAAELRRPDLRFPFPDLFAERLTGETVTALFRRAKYLIGTLSGGEALIMHLGMSGSFRIEETDGAGAPIGDFHIPRSKDQTHDHVVLTLSNGHRIVYNDPRRFGFMTLVEQAGLADHPLFRGLGIEPTGNALNGDALAAAFSGKKTSLKAALLDQRLIAGLGNIYVAEALYRAGLSPFRAAGSIATKAGRASVRAERLAEAIRAVIAEAIAAGGSSLRDYVHADGSLGYFQHSFRVYDREGAPCPTPGCHGTIVRETQNGRSTFHCPSCQK